MRALLVSAVLLAGWTFTSSTRSEAASAARLAAREDDPSAPRLTQRQLHDALEVDDGQAEAQQGAMAAAATTAASDVASSGEEAQSTRSSTFDPAIHALYEDGASAPPVPPSLARGGWKLTWDAYDAAAKHPAAQTLSFSDPRVVLFPSFLTPEEVEHVLAVSRDRLVRSEVLGQKTAGSRVDNVRTSLGTWPPHDAVTDAIEKRIHALVRIPREFGESLYVLSYRNGQHYEAHNDHCMESLTKKVADPACAEFLVRAGGPECGPGHGGPSCGDRVATFILQLVSPTKGGRTVFPHSTITERRMRDTPHAADHAWYCEDERVLGASPSPGDAILFWDYAPGSGPGTGSYGNGTGQPAATPVPRALHSGCPVLEGEKWIATRWIRGSGFDYREPLPAEVHGGGDVSATR